MPDTPFPAIAIGVLIGGIFMLVCYIIIKCIIGLIVWAQEKYEKWDWLHKRNKHRKKCGLKPLKKRVDE